MQQCLTMNEQQEMVQTSGPVTGLRPRRGADIEETPRGETDWRVVLPEGLVSKTVRASFVRHEHDGIGAVDLGVDTVSRRKPRWNVCETR